jgi:hypothetical protein
MGWSLFGWRNQFLAGIFELVMKTPYVRSLILFIWQLGYATVLVFGTVAGSRAQNLELATVPSAAYVPSASAAGDSCLPIISSDGRYILFASTANNLALNTNSTAYRCLRPVSRNVFFCDQNAGSMLLVSADPTDTMGGNDDSMPMAVSTNGQFALFESAATNLFLGDSNPTANVLVRDINNRITLVASIGTNGGCANGASTDSTMTPDGRYVAFSSQASNLVPNDTNGIADVFVRDMQSGTTVLASPGAQAGALSFLYNGGASSDLPEITPDGHFVAFLSTATNLVAGITNVGEIYVRDLVNNLTDCVSTNADRYFTNLACYSQRLSADGQYVAFAAFSLSSTSPAIILRHNVQTGADDLVCSNAALPTDFYKNIQTLDMTPDGRFIAFVGVTNSGSCLLLWDGQTATTTLVSVGTNNSAPPTGATCDTPLLDSTGQHVCFRSTAGNLTTNLINPFKSQHLYLRDLQAGVTVMVDLATNATATAGVMFSPPGMDASGRYMVFDSSGADLTTNDGNAAADVFVGDTAAASIRLVSGHHPALAARTSVLGKVECGLSTSADGRFMAFAATGTGLTPGFTNLYPGVFVRDLVAQTNQLASVTTNGSANVIGGADQAMISGNGRYVVFTSAASNLAKNDTNFSSDVFIRDLQTGSNSLVSVNSAGTGSGYGNSTSPYVSYDGRYVLFNNNSNYVVRDRTAGTNYALTTSGGGIAAAMTPDGHYLGYIDSIDAPYDQVVYVWDSVAAKRVYTNYTLNSYSSLIAISTNGQWLAVVAASRLRVIDRLANTNQIIGNAGGFGPHTRLKFSGDNRYLVYSTAAANVATATNGYQNVYLYDSQTGTNILVSRCDDSNNPGDGDSSYPDLSLDGRYVVYESMADNLVPAGNHHFRNVFLYDQQTTTTMLLSPSYLGDYAGDYASLAPAFTGAGQTVVFQSFASDLTTNDFNSGGAFVLQLASTNAVSGSTNATPFYMGQIIYVPGSAQSGVGPTLTWTATAGNSYQVLYKDNLTDPVWQPLNGSVTIVGSQGQAVDFVPATDHRFYLITVN